VNMKIPVMYHGTSLASWQRDEMGIPLHLTGNRNDAIDYSKDSVENWLLDFKDGEAPPACQQGIVVEFTPEKIEAWVAAGLVRLRPTLGWEEHSGNKSWEAGFSAEGAFRVNGFSNDMKPDGRITPAFSVRPFTKQDAGAALFMIEWNRARFGSGGLAYLPTDEQSFKAWLNDPQSVIVGVFDGAACVGFGGVTRMRVGQMAEQGAGVWYGLDETVEGRGAASLAAREALRGFKNRFPDIRDAYVHCRVGNRKSFHVAERFGMQRTEVADYTRHITTRSVMRLMAHSASVEQVLAADIYAMPAPKTKRNRAFAFGMV